MYKLLYYIALLKKKAENIFLTYTRKYKIRSAYRGFYIDSAIIVSVIVLAAFITGGILIYKFVPIKSKKEQISEEVFFTDTAFATNDSVDISDRFIEPFPIIKGMEDMRYMLVADKYHRVLYLLKQGRRRWGVIKIYPIAIGENEGRKQREGDKKTPEGLYFMVDKKTDRELASIYGRQNVAMYGPHAFILNYPNRYDLQEGRGGSGIWVHGTFENTVPIISRGCIAMHNTYAADLFSIIGDGLLTPVIIINEYHSDFRHLINLEEIWRERKFVAEEFGIDPHTSRKIGKINVRELPAPSSVEEQPITLPAQPTVNITPPRPQQTQLTASAQPLAEQEAEIVQFVNDWAAAWASRNIERYTRFYDTQNFSNWVGHRQQKEATFGLYDSISVVPDNIKVISLNENSVIVRFRQIYRTERSNFSSMKQLRLTRGDGGDWKIIREGVVTE